jgi:predicted ester cyclase
MAEAVTEARSPVELARTVFEEVLNQRDADALRPYWAEEIVEVFPTGTLRGRQAVRDYFAEVFAALPDFHIEAERVAGDEETVFVKWHLSGTFSGEPWMGVEPTGSRIELDGMDCFTVRNGLVVHNHVIYDTTSFARQVGMLPAQGSVGDRAMTAVFNARTRLRDRLRRR